MVKSRDTAPLTSHEAVSRGSRIIIGSGIAALAVAVTVFMNVRPNESNPQTEVPVDGPDKVVSCVTDTESATELLIDTDDTLSHFVARTDPHQVFNPAKLEAALIDLNNLRSRQVTAGNKFFIPPLEDCDYITAPRS